MLQDLFLNATIIITFIAIGNQFIFEKHNIGKHPYFSSKSIFGIITGILGCLLMLYSVTVVPSVIVDFRSIAIIIASIFGGGISAIVASLVIGTFRVLYFGITTSSITAFIIAIIMGVGCTIINSRMISPTKKWGYSTLFCTTIGNIGLIFFVKDIILLIKLISAYSIGSFVIAAILYSYTNRLTASDELFRKYKEESSKDFLTGLNNVRQFDRIFNTITNNILEKEEHLALLFIDIDFFKKVNDNYGHNEGDKVLKELGKIFIKICRDFDIISRNGGEEFSVMLMDCLPQQAITIAERIRSAVEKHPFSLSNGKTINITISIGIAIYPDTTDDFVKLKEEADSALYKAKKTGRNKVVLQEDAVSLN
jgi:diguanylate cyclase